MYPRILHPPATTFFLFGPRGTGKSTWAQQHFPDAPRLDLLSARDSLALAADPQRLTEMLPAGYRGWVVLDEIQRVPALLDEVHRLLFRGGLKFVLTGSSARKLRRQGVNLLAGRALTLGLHPLTAEEVGQDFDLAAALAHGLLPAALDHADPPAFLAAYVQTYLREEVQQEGLTRSVSRFTRFLESAAMSCGQPLNLSAVARESQIERKVVEDYFGILEDLLIGHRLPVFARRAKRDLLQRRKFLFFDAGVFNTLRPRGPLDAPEEIAGIAWETLIFQHLRACNEANHLGYEISYWHTATHTEVDFVLYGPRGLIAIEVKPSRKIRPEDLRGLRAFQVDYPQAQLWLVYGGNTEGSASDRIRILPLEDFLKTLTRRLLLTS